MSYIEQLLDALDGRAMFALAVVAYVFVVALILALLSLASRDLNEGDR